MKKQLFLIFGMSSYLIASSNSYVAMSYNALTYLDNKTTNDFNPTGFKWTIGSVVKEFSSISVALEATAMLGVLNDEKSVVNSSSSGTFSNAKTELDKLYNISIKSTLPIINALNGHAYLGLSLVKMVSTATNYSSDDHWDNGISYGAGLSYDIFEDISLTTNYMQYFKNLNSMELGIEYKF